MDKAAYGAEKKPETNVPELHTVEDVYEWIDKNIEYGWLGQDGKAHICEMKDFRRQYRTMSVSQTIQQKIGTCIEQVALMHELLDTIEVPNQMYCCRIFEPDDYGNLEEEEHMHCFLLYFQNGKTYHMEHPNVEQKGIYEYPTEEAALRTITEYYVKLRGGKESPTTCFSGVPAGGIIPGVQRIYQPSGIGTEQCSETRAVASPEKGVCI